MVCRSGSAWLRGVPLRAAAAAHTIHFTLKLQTNLTALNMKTFDSIARVVCIFLASASIVPAQSAFEVVSVKPHDPKNRNYGYPTCENKRFRSIGTPMMSVFEWAYGLRSTHISALEASLPAWARYDPFDIEAIASERMTESTCRQLVKQTLASRFNVKSHWKTVRDAPRYELVLGPKGHKLKPVSTTDSGCGVHLIFNGQEVPCDRFQWPLAIKRAMSMVELAQALSNFSDRPIVDMTGLKGEYKVTLSFSFMRPEHPDHLPLDRALPAQLGLVLRSGKGDIDFLIVDRIDKPSAN